MSPLSVVPPVVPPVVSPVVSPAVSPAGHAARTPIGTIARVLTGRIGLSPAMIGRTGALRRLRTLIDEADAQCSDLPLVALVAGEAGIGKTRLVREVLRELPADVIVLAGAAEPGSLSRPLDLLAQLAPAGAADPAAAALAEIQAAQGADGGHVVVVVVEDLHWVDADSAAFIDELARRPLPHVVIVGTYRPSDLRRGAPGGDLVSRLERRNEVEQLRLDRLDRHEVGAMMAAISGVPASSAAVEAVTRRSGGVPFVVEELMRCLGPDTCSADIFDVQLPWSLEEAVRQQLADVSAVERAVIDVLAVLAGPAPFDVVVAASQLTDGEVLIALRELMAREVVVELREDRLWFGHALVADTVLHQLLGRERRRIHERCFDALQRLAPDDHAGLARHAWGAGRFDEIVGIAQRGARRYLDRGQTFQALRLACDGLSEDGDQVELLAVATEAAWRLDFVSEALEHARRWRALAVTDRDRIDAQRFVGRLLLELDDRVGAEAEIEELALAAARYELEGRMAEQARAEAAVAQLLMLRHDPVAVDWAERAIGHARRSGDVAVEVQAEVERASALVPGSPRLEALAGLREAAMRAHELGDSVSRARAINNMMELLAPGSAEAGALRIELHQVASSIGFDKLGAARVVCWDALAAEATGDLAEYRRLNDLWLSQSSAGTDGADVFQCIARIALEEGRLDDARAALERSTVTDERRAVGVRLAQLALAGLERDIVGARAAWAQLLATPCLPDTWSVASAAADAVVCALMAGMPVSEVRGLFDGRLFDGQPSSARVAAIVEGFLLVAEHRQVEAVPMLRRALTTAHQDVIRPVEGQLHLSLAQALLAAGDRHGARQAVEDALDALAKWPGWRRDRAEALAGRLESPGARGDGALTARESEVAALIAEGLTNGQLAERLYISPKTAAVHVSNILAKLTLSSRAEIAAWEIRRGLPVVG